MVQFGGKGLRGDGRGGCWGGEGVPVGLFAVVESLTSQQRYVDDASLEPRVLAVTSVRLLPGGTQCGAVAVGLRVDTNLRNVLRGTEILSVLRVRCSAFGCRRGDEWVASEPFTARYPPLIPEAVERATTTVGVVSVVSGSGVAVQQALLQMRLASCEVDLEGAQDLSTSPTQLSFGPAVGAPLRGGIVGNAILFVGCLLLCVAVTVVRAQTLSEDARRGIGRSLLERLRHSASLLSAPGVLTAPFLFLLQPTVTLSVAAMVAASEWETRDIATGSCGLLVIVGLLGYVTATLGLRFRAVAVEVSRDGDGESGRGAVTRALDWTFSPRYEWEDAALSHRAGVSHFTARYGGMFVAYRSGWHVFLLFELWVSFAAGVVGGLIVPGDAARCEGLLIAVCVLNCVTLAAMALVRPYNSRFDTLQAVLNAVLGVVWSILVLVPGHDADAVGVAVAQVWIGMVAIGLSLAEVLRSGRLWRYLHQALGGIFRHRKTTTSDMEMLTIKSYPFDDDDHTDEKLQQTRSTEKRYRQEARTYALRDRTIELLEQHRRVLGSRSSLSRTAASSPEDVADQVAMREVLFGTRSHIRPPRNAAERDRRLRQLLYSI